MTELETTIGKFLCAEMATRPCACGRRPCGDKQSVEAVQMHDRGEDSCGYGRVSLVGKLRCQVCGDAHTAYSSVGVSREIGLEVQVRRHCEIVTKMRIATK